MTPQEIRSTREALERDAKRYCEPSIRTKMDAGYFTDYPMLAVFYGREQEYRYYRALANLTVPVEAR